MRIAHLWPWLLIVVLSACSSRDDLEDGGLAASNLISLFEPAPAAGGPTIPFPHDLLFAGFNDPTLNIPNPGNANPLVSAANLTDGFSTTASVFTDFLGFLDFATAPQGILVIDTSTGRPLTPGQDIAFTDYPATAVIPNSNPPVSAPVNAVRTRVQIKPLKPLKPSTRYLVVVTDALRDLDGNAPVASTQFRITRRATPVSEQTDPSIAVLNPTQRATLELLRSRLIRPAVEGVLAAVPSLSEDNIVLAWTFTTQTIGTTLAAVEARSAARTAPNHPMPLPIFAVPTGLDTSAIGAPPVANIFVGAVGLPYYLQAPADAGDPIIRQTFFAADPTQPDVRTDANGAPIVRFLGQVPCGAFAAGVTLPDGQTAQPSVSTTACFPVPVERSIQRVPLLVTVPNANSGQTRPAGGWPVAIFQHGITRTRADALALAPALAAAGFVVVAIDLPLHGIVATACEPTDRICQGQQQLRAANAQTGARERTFDADLNGDGVAEPSGTYFIELGSLATSRDNLRQGESDLLHLSQLVTRLDLDGDGVPDTNPDRLHFVGHSLGGIVGSTVLGATERLQASSIVTAGGGIARLLDGSRSFGPAISAGLAALAGIEEGTDTYETFLRFAQHLVDDGDPINYAVAAAANQPLHFIEVLGDLVVPNTVVRSPGTATQDRAVTAGLLSGSTPLINRLDLEIVGPITPPVSPVDIRLDPEGLRIAVRFAIGEHGSVLDPTAFPAVTQEMQRQIANFLASQGTCLPIGGSCNAP